MGRTQRIEITTQWCKGCDICVAFCPKQVLALDSSGKAYVARPEDCVYCRDCEFRCPDLAITIVSERVS